MKFTLIKISSILLFTLSAFANNFDLTVTSSTGYSITTTQDGVDNDIDFDMLNMDSATIIFNQTGNYHSCLLYTSPSPRDNSGSRMPSSA